jgi:hypothetical protein
MSKESITDPGGKIYTKEEFQQLFNGNIFRGGGNFEATHMFRIYGWKIPSLAGFVLPQLFARGLGPISKPDENNMKYLDEYFKGMSGTADIGGSIISITRCKVKVLGNVKFPEFVGTIDLSHNKIKNLKGVVFGCCANIILKNNRIESLDDCVFPEGVVGIHLDHNRIKSLKGVKFPSTLKRFSISSNPLETLDGIPPQFLDQVRDGIKHEKQHPELYRKSIEYGFARKDDDDYQPPPIVSPEPSAPPIDPGDLSDLLPHHDRSFYGRLTYEPSSSNNDAPPPPAPNPPPPLVTNAFGDASRDGFFSDSFEPHLWDAPQPPSSETMEFGGPLIGGSRRKNNKKRTLLRKLNRKTSRKLKRKTSLKLKRKTKMIRHKRGVKKTHRTRR